MPRTKLLPQQPDDYEKSLQETLKGYQARLENLWAIFTYKEPNLLNINQPTVNGFINELSEIIGGMVKRRNMPSIIKYLTSVDAVVDKIGRARKELSLAWHLLGKNDTEKNVQSRLDHYDKCQKFLTEAINQFL